MIRFGVIGYGYWGPNIVRNLMSIDGAVVSTVCDTDLKNLQKAKSTYPHIATCQNSEEIFTSDEIDAVAIVTPVSTHFDLAKKALSAGKHVFIEKPITESFRQAETLIALAEQKGLMIMVDHTFIFTGAVRKIKELIDDDSLGKLNYYDSTRVSLGLFQHDVNVIWDLAAHDFSIINYLIPNKPIALTAQGADHMNSGQENIAYITLYYEDNLIVHINVNWLSPVKIRTTMIGGQKKMLLWDDLNSDEKIKIYDKGVHVKSKESAYKLMVDYRMGDMSSPWFEKPEALKTELEYFVECLQNNEPPVNDGWAGLRVVRMLELADQSLKEGGKLIHINQESLV